jgi:release factor glutamine methyltransferase
MPGVAAGVASVREALAAAVDGMAAAGVDEPRLDAELLLGEAMGCGRERLAADPDARVPAPAARAFGEMVRRRSRREPVAYILGRKGFRRIELAVDSRVLVPRPETELLVEVALERRPARLLDVGTGSGAIALAVAEELPECEVVATDTSPGALELARANAASLGLGARVSFAAGTLPGPEAGGGGFDLILANLPYVAASEWSALEPEVTRWEPREALLAGPDGLDAYRTLIPALGVRSSSPYPAPSANANGGAALAVEVGEEQAPAVAELMRDAGFAGIEARRDLAGIERVVVGLLSTPGRVEKDNRGAGL